MPPNSHAIKDRNLLRVIGNKTLFFFEEVGAVAMMIKDIFAKLPKVFRSFHLTTEQMLSMGVNSLP
ncbi:MAG: hypothetical protein WBD28_09715, partial [Candidatus Zixiibacteriota bacterium]